MLQRMAKSQPNFRRLDCNNRDIAVLIGAMLAAREAIERRSWNTPKKRLMRIGGWKLSQIHERGSENNQSATLDTTSQTGAPCTRLLTKSDLQCR